MLLLDLALFEERQPGGGGGLDPQSLLVQVRGWVGGWGAASEPAAAAALRRALSPPTQPRTCVLRCAPACAPSRRSWPFQMPMPCSTSTTA